MPLTDKQLSEELAEVGTIMFGASKYVHGVLSFLHAAWCNGFVCCAGAQTLICRSSSWARP